MLRGTKYLVASPKIINRIQFIKKIKDIEEEEQAKVKAEEAAKVEAEESTIMCLGDGGDDNIFCE